MRCVATKKVLGGMLAFFLMSSCGVEEDNSSRLGAESTPVSTSVENRLPTLQDGSWRRHVDKYSLERLAEQLLAERLRSLGLIPSQLPEFFQFSLVLDHLEGCHDASRYQDAACPDNFRFDVKLVAKAGPDVLDEVTRQASFSSLNRAEVRRRLDWTIKLALDTMVAHGTLGELAVETPYYSLETPYY